MAKRFSADGDSWDVTVDHGDEAPGVNAIVFHCVSNPQRPYRVARLDREDAERAPAELGQERLHALFERSQVMGYVRDREALPDAPLPPTPHDRL